MPQVPKNAPYHIEEAEVCDSNTQVSKIKNKKQYALNFRVVPNSGIYAFEIDDGIYKGKFSVKGAKVDYAYTDYEGTLVLNCVFTALDNDKTALQKGGSFKKADKVIRSKKTNKSLAGSALRPLRLKAVKKTKKTIKLRWKKVKGAKKYVIYGAMRNRKFVKIKTVKKLKYTVKKAGAKLKKNKRYKFIVVAVSGGKVISTSRTVNVRTKKR